MFNNHREDGHEAAKAAFDAAFEQARALGEDHGEAARQGAEAADRAFLAQLAR